MNDWISPPEAMVDFNAASSTAGLTVSRRLIVGITPSVGQPLRLIDGEGDNCLGVVQTISEKSVRVHLLLNTWTSPPADLLSPAIVGTMIHGADQTTAAETVKPGDMKFKTIGALALGRAAAP